MIIRQVSAYAPRELTYSPNSIHSNMYPTAQTRQQIPIHSQVQGYTRSNGYPIESHVQTNQAYDQRNYGYSNTIENRNGLRSQQYPQPTRTMYQNY